MTDYFALLDQARAPWLDPASLKDAYHRRTLQTHPDTGADKTESGFAELNEAFQVLQDPKRRLHHLLALEGRAPSSWGLTVPQELQDLFPAIGALTQRANLFLEKAKAATNALSRSLLKPQLLELQKETAELREKIQALSDATLAQLRVVNSSWATNPSEELAALSNLYFTFAYLGRWSAQLDEIAFQLSLH
ncbi:MAG TPA: DnaJ domain-containing protein [Chthoniobacterales bacterium]|nr:DnaJ domain-containing protein [Chthoniobacterales bacterium]